MAALVLSVAGSAAGAVFGPAGALAGRIAGALAGNLIDQSLFGSTSRTVVGPRLADLDVMASTEGAPIPRVYGRARASFSSEGTRYSEMRAIKQDMAARRFSDIPDRIRSMKRLWTTPSVRGVALRREQEARLFEKGLVDLKALA